MTITINAGATTLSLNEDLYWADEHSWQPVEQGVESTLTGAIVVSTHERLAGRPITLKPFDERSGWLTHAGLVTLRNWAATPGQQMTLTIRGVARTVIFRHHDGPAIDVTPIKHMSDTDANDYYLVTLRFMEL